MKSNWQTKKLGELFTIERGGSPRPIDSYLTDAPNGINWIKIGDAKLGAKYIYSTTEKIKPEGVSKTRLVYKGDFLLSNSMSFGRPYILNIDGAIHDGWLVIRNNESVVDSNYLYYSLCSDFIYRQFDNLASGATVRNLNTQLVKSVKITYPESLSEQKRIVKVLDEVFEKIEKTKKNAEKNLKYSNLLFEGYLKGVFMNSNGKWEAKTLREVSIQFGRGRSKHRPRNDKKLYNGEYPFIQTGDIRNATHIIRTYSQTYNELGLAQSKLWPKGTICITIAANIAETSILGFDACFPDSVIGLTVKPDLADANFTEYLLQFYKSRIKLKGKGSAQANINMETFENEKFLFPTVQEQRLIAKNLDQLSDRHKRLEEIYKQKLSALDEFKKSILQKAFAGELIESTESKVKPFEVQQAIGAILRNDFERGEMITAKVLYLSQEIYGVPLNIPFTAQNFGPYDPHIKKAITAGLMKHNKFFKKKHTNNGDVFALDQGSQKLFKYQSQVLVKMNEALSDLMKYIKSADSPSIERLATVCKIIQDNRTTNLSIVWGKMKEWKGNKFTEEQVSRSLHFIVEHKWDIVLLKKHE